MGGWGSYERPARALWTPQHWQDQPGEFCLWHICAHVTMQFTIGSFCKECSGNLIGICGYPDRLTGMSLQ